MQLSFQNYFFTYYCLFTRMSFIKAVYIMQKKKLQTVVNFHSNLPSQNRKPLQKKIHSQKQLKINRLQINDKKKIFQSPNHIKIEQPNNYNKSPRRLPVPIQFHNYPKKQSKSMNFIPIQKAKQHIIFAAQCDQPRHQRNTEAGMQLRHRPLFNDIQRHERGSLSGRSGDQQYQISRGRKTILSERKSFLRDESFGKVSNSNQSSNSQKKGGIELTKLLLKKISDMYTDKDFQGSYTKRKEETTGLTLEMSQKIQDQYQLSTDFQMLKISNNHTVSSGDANVLSFNESGHYNNRNNHNPNWITKMQPNNNYYGNQLKNQPQPHNPIRPQTHQLLNNIHSSCEFQQKRDSFECKKISPQRPISNLIKVKSLDLMNLKPTSQSIVVEPPKQFLNKQRPKTKFVYQGTKPRQQQIKINSQYLIESKNMTLDDMSVKQSLIIGFDNYYQ